MSLFPTATARRELNVAIKDDHIALSRSTQDLSISFQRSIRVPDNGKISNPPPSFGKFPLLEVKYFVTKLPRYMAAKGGFFFPMYKREAMWINFSSSTPFAIKIYVGGINAVSGEPAIKTDVTLKHRIALLRKEKCIQDYIVSPNQDWPYGVVGEGGNVRQFVAMASHSGYSAEA